MKKFSYEVIAVRHEDGEKSKIIKYKVKDLSNGLINVFERAEMFGYLGAAIPIGVRESPEDEELVFVHIVIIGSNYYIKTIENETPDDNLGNLPEF